jgi:hypothetical protein
MVIGHNTDLENFKTMPGWQEGKMISILDIKIASVVIQQ